MYTALTGVHLFSSLLLLRLYNSSVFFFVTPIKPSSILFSSTCCCWPTRVGPVLPPLLGLPLPHRLRAAVQLAPPRRGCVAIAEGAVPVCGDFLFASAGLFVTKRDVTVRQKGETATKVKSSLKEFKDLLHGKELWLLSTPRTLQRFSRLWRHGILELWSLFCLTFWYYQTHLGFSLSSLSLNRNKWLEQH